MPKFGNLAKVSNGSILTISMEAMFIVIMMFYMAMLLIKTKNSLSKLESNMMTFACWTGTLSL